MKIVLLLIIVFSAIEAWSVVQLDRYSLGYGILSSGILTEAVTDTGETAIYGSFSAHFLDANISWAHDNINLSYHIKTNYTLLPRETEDGAADITQWRFSTLLGYDFNKNRKSRFYITYGLGVLGTISKGNGGIKLLNNGTNVRPFYRPSTTAHSKLLMLEVGMTRHFTEKFSFSVDAMVNGLFGDRRNLNLYMSLNYFWDHAHKRKIKKLRNNKDVDDDSNFKAGEAPKTKKMKKKTPKGKDNKKNKEKLKEKNKEKTDG